MPGKWAGKQQDSSTANQLVTHGGPGADPLKAQQAGDFLSFIALAGFGELGETALRPSSVGPGFYVELELMNRVYGMEMGRQQAKGMGSLDPISTMVNQYNPVAMMATATQNVRLATLSGKNEGYMWEAQAINMLKQPIVASGTALILISPGAGPFAPLVALAGAAVMAAGNSINVNPTTGERAMKMTDQAAITTGVSLLTLGSGVGEGLSAVAQAAVAATVALAQSGMRYDAEGRSQGWGLKSKHGDMHGENVLISAAVAGVVGGLGAAGGQTYGGSSNLSQAVFGDVLSTGANVLTEYGKQQTWGKDKSGYDALGRPDAGRLGALAGSMVIAANKDRYEGNAIAAAQKAAKEGNKQKALDILKAGGFSEDRRRKLADSMEAKAFLASELSSDDALKKLRTAAGGKGGLFGDGPVTTETMSAGAQLTEKLRAELAGLGRAPTNEDVMRLARENKIDVNRVFSGENAVKAEALFGVNWSDAYNRQSRIESAGRVFQHYDPERNATYKYTFDGQGNPVELGTDYHDRKGGVHDVMNGLFKMNIAYGNKMRELVESIPNFLPGVSDYLSSAAGDWKAAAQSLRGGAYKEGTNLVIARGVEEGTIALNEGLAESLRWRHILRMHWQAWWA